MGVGHCIVDGKTGDARTKCTNVFATHWYVTVTLPNASPGTKRPLVFDDHALSLDFKRPVGMLPVPLSSFE